MDISAISFRIVTERPVPTLLTQPASSCLRALYVCLSMVPNYLFTQRAPTRLAASPSPTLTPTESKYLGLISYNNARGYHTSMLTVFVQNYHHNCFYRAGLLNFLIYSTSLVESRHCDRWFCVLYEFLDCTKEQYLRVIAGVNKRTSR